MRRAGQRHRVFCLRLGCLGACVRQHAICQSDSLRAGLNGGIMLFRNSDWSRDFLDSVAHFGQFPPNMTTEQACPCMVPRPCCTAGTAGASPWLQAQRCWPTVADLHPAQD